MPGAVAEYNVASVYESAIVRYDTIRTYLSQLKLWLYVK